ncbi:MAG TPA: hypothetical protein PKC45_08110 [Gemmatales bacterium]|nr:hypothetical protein [Gemmatales bacterium]
MVDRPLTIPVVAEPSRGVASTLATVPENGVGPTLGSLWPTLLTTLPPPERQRLVDQAAEAGFIVTQPWPDHAGSAAALTPAQWLLDELAAGFLEGLHQRQPPPPPGDPALLSVPRADQTVAAALASPDLFLLVHGAHADPLPWIARCLEAAVRAGERLLVLLPPAAASDGRWSTWLEHQELFTTVVAAPELLGAADSAWSRVALGRRIEAMHAHLAADVARRQELLQAVVQSAEARVWAAQDWRGRWLQLGEMRAAIEQQVQSLAGIAKQVKGILMGSEREPTLEVAHRHLAEEQERHEAAYLDLQTRLNEAEAKRHELWLQVEKWRQQVKQQEEFLAQRSALKPWHPRWWTSLFQGRGKQRLEEFRTRCAEAKEALEQAEEGVRDALNMLEIETQRHTAARDQIIADAVRQRQESVNQELAEVRGRIAEAERDWAELVSALDGAGQVEVCPQEADLEPLIDLANRRLAEAQSALARHHAKLPDEAQLRDLLLDRYSGLVIVLAPGAEAVMPELLGKRPFDRLIATTTETRPIAALRGWLGLARRAILVGADGGDSEFARWLGLLKTGALTTTLTWHSSGDRLRCVWDAERHKSGTDVQMENLVTHPDVELQIATDAAGEPRLVAVEFPAERFSIVEAKRILYEELGELTLAPGWALPHWQLTPAGWVWALGADAGEGAGTAVELEPGLREVMSQEADGVWQTRRLEFSLAHEWNWDRIWEWMMQHLAGSALARFASLEAVDHAPEVRSEAPRGR